MQVTIRIYIKRMAYYTNLATLKLWNICNWSHCCCLYIHVVSVVGSPYFPKSFCLLRFLSDLKEIDLSELQLLEELGTGNFGVRITIFHCLAFR